LAAGARYLLISGGGCLRACIYHHVGYIGLYNFFKLSCAAAPMHNFKLAERRLRFNLGKRCFKMHINTIKLKKFDISQ
jgi:hypothetical protein